MKLFSSKQDKIGHDSSQKNTATIRKGAKLEKGQDIPQIEMPEFGKNYENFK